MSLDQLAIRHGADKSSLAHNYCVLYERFFDHLRNDEITLMEIGYGGYIYPERGGAGAKMWADYFHKGKIVTIDFYEKNPPKHDRIKLFRGGQDDETFLTSVVTQEGQPDIIVDDASHISPLTIRTFEILFPLLKSGGVYVIEDLHASYWHEPATDGTEFKGGIDNPRATLNFLKTLVDSINHEHCTAADQKIKAIHFFEKIVFIEKV